MPKFNDRFTGLFRGSNPKEIISEAEQIVVPSDLDIFDEELNTFRNAPATPINDRHVWYDWEELKGITARETGGLEGRSMDVVETRFPDKTADTRNRQLIEWDNDLARQEHMWRNHPVLKDLPQNPNYFKLKDDWSYRGKIAPDSLALLEEEIRIHKQPLNVPRSFGSNDEEYWQKLVDQWGNSRRQRIAATMDPADPRVYTINQNAKRSEKNMKNFIETMDNPSSTVPAPRVSKYSKPKSMDELTNSLDKLNQQFSEFDKEYSRISDTASRLLTQLGDTPEAVDYEGPHIFYKDQTTSQKLNSINEDLRQQSQLLDSYIDDNIRNTASTVTPTPTVKTVKPNVSTKTPISPSFTRPTTRLGAGVRAGSGALLGDIAVGGAMSYLTGETDDPKVAGWAGVTGLIPQSTNTAMGTMPMTIGGKQYHRTSEPSKVIGPGGKYYGLEYLNGKPQIVPYGRGAAGLAPIYQPVVDTVDAINTTSTRRKAEARKANETRIQRAKKRFAKPGRVIEWLTDLGVSEYLGIN
jgi:hypothetical protein